MFQPAISAGGENEEEGGWKGGLKPNGKKGTPHSFVVFAHSSHVHALPPMPWIPEYPSYIEHTGEMTTHWSSKSRRCECEFIKESPCPVAQSKLFNHLLLMGQLKPDMTCQNLLFRGWGSFRRGNQRSLDWEHNQQRTPGVHLTAEAKHWLITVTCMTFKKKRIGTCRQCKTRSFLRSSKLSWPTTNS